jgi:signal transduction histidine kinase
MPEQEPLRSLTVPLGQRSRRNWLLASAAFLPVLVALPVLLGLHLGLFDPPFALALLVVVLIAIQTFVLWRDNLTLAHAETARAHAELALLQNEKLAAVGRLSASIAHEINNPLEAVNNLLYLIRLSDSVEQMAGYAALAEQELERVTQITTQTLSFYKESRSPAPCVPDDLVHSSVKLLTTRIQGSGATITTDHRGPTRSILCKDGELRQVLINLLSNATDAAPRGRIRVRVHTSRWWKPGGADGVRILVADNGTGIPPEHRARIFEPFFTTKAEQGNGLGLWVARNLVEAHGGFLRVRSSTRPGGSGTIFCLFIPAAAGQ